MVKRSTLYLNTRRITSFYCKGGNAKSNNINKQLLMSPDEVDRCNDILKARKSAVNRGKDPEEAEMRIRRKYEKKACLKNKITYYYKARASSISKAKSSKQRKSEAKKPQAHVASCEDKVGNP